MHTHDHTQGVILLSAIVIQEPTCTLPGMSCLS